MVPPPTVRGGTNGLAAAVEPLASYPLAKMLPIPAAPSAFWRKSAFTPLWSEYVGSAFW